MRFSILALMFSSASGHTTVVCTSTSPSRLGEMEIFLGTYHWVRSARGQITITDPDEMEHAFDLTQICNGGQARYGGKCPAADIKDACIGSEKDDVVQCYQLDSTGQEASVLDDDCKAQPTRGSYRKSVKYARAKITGLKTGLYIINTKGTDDNFAPCNYGGYACQIGRRPIRIPLSLPGVACKGPPAPIAKLEGDVSGCATKHESICPVKCAEGHALSEPLICIDGQWSTPNCKAKQCGCKNGMGAKGKECPDEDANVCEACDEGFELWKKGCHKVWPEATWVSLGPHSVCRESRTDLISDPETVHDGLQGLHECMEKCKAKVGCAAVEFRLSEGRCEMRAGEVDYGFDEAKKSTVSGPADFECLVHSPPCHQLADLKQARAHLNKGKVTAGISLEQALKKTQQTCALAEDEEMQPKRITKLFDETMKRLSRMGPLGPLSLAGLAGAAVLMPFGCLSIYRRASRPRSYAQLP